MPGSVAATLGVAAAQEAKRPPVEPAAGNWHTWVIPSGSAVSVPPPPGAEASRAELEALKTQPVP